ncbi:hypothetical protein B0H13DRAFT_2365277 [Mycena leptocephala]|nr:hypothetical protein B0H13DRAFT_2365277 [Mycena leptocephala]
MHLCAVRSNSNSFSASAPLLAPNSYYCTRVARALLYPPHTSTSPHRPPRYQSHLGSHRPVDTPKPPRSSGVHADTSPRSFRAPTGTFATRHQGTHLRIALCAVRRRRVRAPLRFAFPLPQLAPAPTFFDTGTPASVPASLTESCSASLLTSLVDYDSCDDTRRRNPSATTAAACTRAYCAHLRELGWTWRRRAH